MNRPFVCDFQYETGAFCDDPAVYVALSTAAPALRDTRGAHASIGGFCARHVELEARPSRAEAQRVQAIVEPQAEDYHRAIWKALLANYPEPLRIEDEDEWLSRA